MRASLVVSLSLLLFACAEHEDEHFEEGPLGVWRAAVNVGEAGGCSTSVVAGLSRQLIDEINCLRPNTLADFGHAQLRLGAAVWPFLQPPARDALHAALRAKGGNLSINSALRTLAQQYLLYRWYREGRCGIALAASPGRSNHESGLAIDTSDQAAWRATLTNRGWRWLGANDPVHFDYVGGGTVDLRGLSVRAFQRLWNRNNPNDRIDEDGVYGPQTEARLRRSPTDGFRVGACQAQPEPPPPPPPPQDAVVDVVVRWTTIDGQARDLVAEGSSAGIFDVVAGQRFEARLEVRNGAGRPRTDDVRVGYQLTSDHVRIVAFEVGGERAEAPAAEGFVQIGRLDPNQTRALRFELEAVRPSFGAVRHVGLRGWVAHIGDYYGEQDGWDDPVEHNGAGRLLRHAGELDVFATDRWTFDGPDRADTEGWRACDGGALHVDPGFHALVVDGGCVRSPAWTAIDAGQHDALRVTVRAEGQSARVVWPGGAADLPLRGDGASEAFTLDLRDAPGWTGTITELRVEADAPLALEALETVRAVSGPDPELGPDAGPHPGPDPDSDAGGAPPVGRSDGGPAGRDGAAGQDDGGVGFWTPDPQGPGSAPPPGGDGGIERGGDARFEGGCRASPGAAPGTLAPIGLLLLMGLRRKRPSSHR